MLSEVLGCFFLVLIFLCMNEQEHEDDDDCDKENHSGSGKRQDPLSVSLFWSIAYVFCVNLANGSVLNPAVSVSIILTQVFDGADFDFATFAIFTFLPFAGGILALAFFQMVYLKTKIMGEEEIDEDVRLLPASNTEEL
jgi:glycerol uptake facilitator-like aquaporin